MILLSKATRNAKWWLVIAGLLGWLLASVGWAGSDWPMYQYNAQHIGYNPNSTLTPPLQLSWVHPLCSTPLMQPTVAEGKVYVTITYEPSSGDVPQMWCMDADTGEMRWHLFFGEGDHQPWWVMQPAYSYGMLYVQVCDYMDSYVVALTPDSAELIWGTGYRSQSYWSLAPTVYNGKVTICGNTYGGMHCFDALSGQLLWKNKTFQIEGWTPSVYRDTAYVSFGRYLFAFDNNSGDAFWSFLAADTPSVGLSAGWPSGQGNAPVVDTVNQVIHYTMDDGRYAFDLTSGQLLWEKRGERRYRITPAIYDGKVYAIQEGVVIMFDGLSGDSLGAFAADEEFYYLEMQAPVIVPGYLFVSSTEKTYALDVNTLEEVWRCDVSGHLAVGADHLFIAANTGELYAYGNLPTDVDDVHDNPVPNDFTLAQNYPNPFNNYTVIRYNLPTRSYAEIAVYNVLGRKVTTLVNSVQPAGSHRVEWNGTDSRGQEVSSGMYFFRLKTEDFVDTRKMLLLK